MTAKSLLGARLGSVLGECVGGKRGDRARTGRARWVVALPDGHAKGLRWREAWLYPDRVTGGDRDHRDSGRFASPGAERGQGVGPPRGLHQQPQADYPGFLDVRARQQ